MNAQPDKKNLVLHFFLKFNVYVQNSRKYVENSRKLHSKCSNSLTRRDLSTILGVLNFTDDKLSNGI